MLLPALVPRADAGPAGARARRDDRGRGGDVGVGRGRGRAVASGGVPRPGHRDLDPGPGQRHRADRFAERRPRRRVDGRVPEAARRRRGGHGRRPPRARPPRPRHECPATVCRYGPGHGSSRVSFPGGFLGVTGALVPLDQYIVETWGLANTVGAHLEYAPGAHRNWPGHRKPLGDVWLLALELDPSVTDVPGIAAVTPASLAAARHALGCGDLRELLASVREPLTASRFLRNLTGAYHRTALRIPRDPFAAEAKFCGAR
ncbi:hypothetical protein ACU686_22125 [Yinghuangia aomiensis]